MSEIVLWALPLVAIALGIAVEWLASKAVNAAAHREFDGGFSHDHGTIPPIDAGDTQLPLPVKGKTA